MPVNSAVAAAEALQQGIEDSPIGAFGAAFGMGPELLGQAAGAAAKMAGAVLPEVSALWATSDTNTFNCRSMSAGIMALRAYM